MAGVNPMNRRTLLKMMATACLPTALAPLQTALAAKAINSGRRLVLVELSGANDGLNTLVPIRNDHYYRLRPSIGLDKNSVIGLQADLGIHKALEPMMNSWDRGEVAWVQGLGYPQPNRSHFKSIALWESGGDGHRSGAHGWMTHDIEHKLGRNIVDAHGISLRGDLNLFRSKSGRWMSLESTQQVNAADTVLPESGKRYNTALDIVAGKMHELHHTMGSLEAKLSKTAAVKAVANNDLGNQLAHVVRLIRSGVDTPVYRVQLGGFDTHTYQLDRHARLLNQLAKAIAGLRKQLVRDNEWQNTLVMTYSEFGRRAAENSAGGTDHGSAAPHLLAGGAVNGGLYGSEPNLGKLVDGDPTFTMDYRALYDRVLADWFGVNDNAFNSHRRESLQGLLI